MGAAGRDLLVMVIVIMLALAAAITFAVWKGAPQCPSPQRITIGTVMLLEGCR